MKLRVFAAIVLLCALARPAFADERILRYDIEVAVNADGRLDVVERITARAEGSQIRRGLYRDFPTRYRDRYGNRVVAGFEVVGLERDGRPEPWFVERRSNGVRVNFGNDDFLPVPAEYTYTLRYQTTRQVGFFEDHDELYWNAIGTGWIFPIDASRVDVRLPAPVPIAQLQAEAYTGPQGAQGQEYTARVVEAGSAQWDLASTLAPREGFTIVLSFPKGVVAEPGAARRLAWLLGDNRGVLVMLAGFAWLLTFTVRRWRQVGRDPRQGVIIARYEPPDGHTPADLRLMKRMGYDPRCFSSDVLALAVAGHLTVHTDDGFFRDTWWLERQQAKPDAPALAATQRTLLDLLFPGGKNRLDLKKSNPRTVSASQAHAKALDHLLHPRYFKRNAGSWVAAGGIALLTTVLAFVVSGGGGLPVIIVVSILMLAIVILFGILVRAPTPLGRELLDQIEGLTLYLTVAERDELERMPGPDGPPALDAGRYEMLLPFAVALEVEDAWTAKFTAAVGTAAAAAAASGIAWYHGGRVSDLGSLSRAVGGTLSSQIASASSPPGGSSGSGGGGSSGGGGGGGGGGGR